MKKILYSLFFCLFIISSCNNTETDSNRVLIVGTSADNPPYEYIKDKDILGIDIDLIKKIAKGMNREIKINNMPFDSLIPALQMGSIDIAIAGMTATDSRKAMVLFSIPYTETASTIVSLNTHPIKNTNDAIGKKIGVQKGTTLEEYANNIASKHTNTSVIALPDNSDLIEMLLNKKIDLIITESVQAKILKSTNSEVMYFEIPSTKAEFAIAVNKKSRQLMEKINTELAQLKNNGSVNLIMMNYFSQ